MGNSMGPIVADPTGADGLVPICTTPGQGVAAPAPRIEGFVRSFDEHAEYNLCTIDYGDDLADLGERVSAFLSVGCLPTIPCDGVTAADVVVTSSGVQLAPGEYTVEGDAACASGWRVRPMVGPGVEVTVTYPAGPGACP
jgi:hypothetical protein